MGIRPIALASAVIFAGAAIAQDTEDKLQIDGQSFVTETSAPAHLDNLSTIYSGWLFRTDETQALQTDDFDNPAMIFVDQALDLFQAVDGSEGKIPETRLPRAPCSSSVRTLTGHISLRFRPPVSSLCSAR